MSRLCNKVIVLKRMYTNVVTIFIFHIMRIDQTALLLKYVLNKYNLHDHQEQFFNKIASKPFFLEMLKTDKIFDPCQ